MKNINRCESFGNLTIWSDRFVSFIFIFASVHSFFRVISKSSLKNRIVLCFSSIFIICSNIIFFPKYQINITINRLITKTSHGRSINGSSGDSIDFLCLSTLMRNALTFFSVKVMEKIPY